MLKKLWLFLALLTLASCSKVTPDANIDLSQPNGKNTFVGFVATWCPHCKEELPIYQKFYDAHKTEVNMQLFVTDGKQFGPYTIPQDLTNALTYEMATGEKCEYVPSYIIYDGNKKIIDKKCGAKLSYEDLESKLLTQKSQSGATASGSTASGNTLESNDKKKMINNYQTMGFQEGDLGVIMTTSNGKITFRMFEKEAPKAVFNFIALAQNGYYNNVVFHRVIKNFMIQWGDPTASGMGWESIYKKEFEDEFDAKLSNIKGSLSMANAGKATNGSQFFVNQVDNTYLDNKHTVFGQVVEGFDNVEKIASTKVGKNDKPEKDVKIIKMEVMKYSNGKLTAHKVDIEAGLKDIENKAKAKKEENAQRTVKAGDEIAVHYVGTITSTKEEFDSSYKRNSPLEFTVGSGMMIKGFDAGVIGMKIGEKKTLSLKAKDAYGEYDKTKIQKMNKSDLKPFEEAGIKLEKGAKLPTQYGEFSIIDADDTTVSVDMNHFLSGKDLTFVVEMVEFKN